MRAGIFGYCAPNQLAGPYTIIGTVGGRAWGAGSTAFSFAAADSFTDNDENTVAMLSGAWLNSPVQIKFKSSQVSTPEAFAQLKGPLQGMHLNRLSGVLTLHADSAGRCPIFLYAHQDTFLFGSSMADVTRLARLNGLILTPDNVAAAALLAFASVPGSRTLVAEIRKVLPGQSVIMRDGLIHSIDRNVYGTSIDTYPTDVKAIDALQATFSESVRSMTAFDIRFGTGRHNLLSGGIDSRMVLLETLRHITDVNTYCFSKGGYADMKISGQLAEVFGTRHTFYDLDDGAYLARTDTVDDYDGLINYLASAHHRAMLDKLAPANIGLLAAGQLGNEVMGEFARPPGPPEAIIRSMVTMSSQYRGCADYLEEVWADSPDPVWFKLRNRGFLFSNSAAYSTRHFGFLYSPFTDPDFLHVALSLNSGQRLNQRLYLAWIARCYPEALRFDWERYGVKPVNGPVLSAARLWKKAQHRFWYPKFNPAGASMNPLDWWVRRSAHLQEHFEKTFELHRDLLDFFPEIAERVSREYSGMGVFNKASVLTLLLSTSKTFAES